MRRFFTSFRRAEPASVAAIQRELTALRAQHQQMTAARDRVALAAVNVVGAAVRWRHLNEAAAESAQRMAVLTAALPAAEEREAEAAQQAEAVRRERAMVAYQRFTQEAQRSIDAVVASLPTGETLTALRDLRDRLASEARDLRTWSNLPEVRRPPDPLSAVVDAMQYRLDRVVRARWAPKSPITLKAGATSSELSEATARVEDAS
jgi:hypothetical protein